MRIRRRSPSTAAITQAIFAINHLGIKTLIVVVFGFSYAALPGAQLALGHVALDDRTSQRRQVGRHRHWPATLGLDLTILH